jgi:hypothetical protein
MSKFVLSCLLAERLLNRASSFPPPYLQNPPKTLQNPPKISLLRAESAVSLSVPDSPQTVNSDVPTPYAVAIDDKGEVGSESTAPDSESRGSATENGQNNNQNINPNINQNDPNPANDNPASPAGSGSASAPTSVLNESANESANQSVNESENESENGSANPAKNEPAKKETPPAATAAKAEAFPKNQWPSETLPEALGAQAPEEVI